MSRAGERSGPAVTGWRYWRLRPGPLRLCSLSQRGVDWPPGRPLAARCLAGAGVDGERHAAPGTDCGCGVHAGADLASLHAQALCLRPVPLVVGHVRLWGRVITDERGGQGGRDHRGALASPEHLWVVGETLPEAASLPAVLAELARTYAVPVGTMSLEEAVGPASRTILGHLAMSGPPEV